MTVAPELQRVLVELRGMLGAERWLDKRGIAAHFSCSVRWIEERVHEGLPHCVLAGALKFRVSEVECWLEQHGHLQRRGVDDGETMVVATSNGAAPLTRPAPGHRRD